MNKIQNEGQWVDISAQLNSNFEQIKTDIIALQQTSWANKGYYYTEEDLLSTHPTSNVGDRAFVGSAYPYAIYLYTEDGWIDTGETGDAAELQLKSHVDNHEQQLSNLETQLRIESDGNSETIADIHSNLETLNTTANKQLNLSVLDNGNIVLSNANGESKEFMPATPSGDPMHYAYVNAGAEYNATGADIVKNAPWADLADADEDKVVVHKAGYWYLNGLGDLTNTDMSNIYRRGHDLLETAVMAYGSCTANNIKTNLDFIYKYGHSTLSTAIISYNYTIIVLNCMKDRTRANVYWKNNNSFAIESSKSFLLSHILGMMCETPQNGVIKNAPHLKTIKIQGLQQNISFPNSPVLTKTSVLYMINNSNATSAITITLHADAYARAMADASIVEALRTHTNVTLASA